MEVKETNGIRSHIFKLSQEAEINECLAHVRLHQHGIQVIPGTFFAQGKIVIFENLDPVEDEDESVVKIGATEEEMLRGHDQKWRKLQKDLLDVDLTLEYFKGRKGKGSKNTQLDTEKTIKKGEELRESLLGQMAMCKREATLVLAGRYPQLSLPRVESESYASTLELPQLDTVEPETIYQPEDGGQGQGPRSTPRKGS